MILCPVLIHLPAGLWFHLLDAASGDQCSAVPSRGNVCAGWTGGQGGIRRGLERESAGALWRSKVRHMMYHDL